MPKYFYQAYTETGQTTFGEILSDSAENASNTLSARGLIPTTITGETERASRLSLQNLKAGLTPIKAPELIIFTKQFKTMLRSGVPMVKLLEVLQVQTENLNLRNIVGAMLKNIKEGASLYEAFKRHPKAFSPLYCSMIRAGEVSGALPNVLERLIYIMEHEDKIKSDVKSALQYPIIVLVFLFVAFFILLTFVIPKFIGIFTRAGIAIPLPTQICLYMYNFFVNYWVLIVGAVATTLALAGYYLKTDQGKYLRDSLMMRIPVIGPLFIKAAMTRFASIFSILHSSGVAILDAMKILSGTIGNYAIAREFDRINERLEEGRGIAGPLKSARYFSPLVINMVAIGEESGRLEEMLHEISEHYDSEMEYSMKKLSETIGPILTIGLAAVIGFFALAIFLPMWDLTKMVK